MSAFTTSGAWWVNVLWHSRRMRGSDVNNAQQIASAHASTMPEHVDPSRARCGGSEVNNYINTVQFLAQTDVSCLKTSMYRHKPQGLMLFCLCMFRGFFTLKAMGPIDCRCMTDRLQPFSVKNLSLCSTEETKSLTSCPGGNHFWSDVIRILCHLQCFMGL